MFSGDLLLGLLSILLLQEIPVIEMSAIHFVRINYRSGAFLLHKRLFLLVGCINGRRVLNFLLSAGC
jgi:hypothetical protein